VVDEASIPTLECLLRRLVNRVVMERFSTCIPPGTRNPSSCSNYVELNNLNLLWYNGVFVYFTLGVVQRVIAVGLTEDAKIDRSFGKHCRSRLLIERFRPSFIRR